MSEEFQKLWRSIGDRESFQEVLTSIECKDVLQAGEIRAELIEVFKQTDRFFLNDANGNDFSQQDLWVKRSILLQEMLNLKAHVKRYSDMVAKYTSIENDLQQRVPQLLDGFFNGCAAGLDRYFAEKEKVLHAEIDARVSWRTEPQDKMRTLAREIADIGGSAAERVGDRLDILHHWTEPGRKFLKGFEAKARNVCEQISPETTINQIWQEHMGREEEDIGTLFLAAWRSYEQQWQVSASYDLVCQDPDFGLYYPHAATNAKLNEPGNPALRVGGAGAFAGAAATVSIAMGWHTFSYAISHVFPPALLFSMAAAVWTGHRKQEMYRTEIKNQISRCLRLIRQDYVQLWFEGRDVDGRPVPLRTALIKDAKERVGAALVSWQRRLFGKLTVEDYTALIAAIEQHLALIGQGLTQLDEIMNGLSRKTDGFQKFVDDFGRQYPGLDEESLGILATGEVLVQMHTIRPFFECSPIALPFTKVLERELYQIFRENFDQQNQKFMLGTFLYKVRNGEIQRKLKEDFLDKVFSVNLVRCSMAHRDLISFERAMQVRALVIGEGELLREIWNLAQTNEM